MEIKNFKWDVESVSWLYDGKSISVSLKNINFANIDMHQECIQVVCGENFSENQIHYLSFYGKEILACNRIEGKITWGNTDKKVEINYTCIENIKLYIKEGIVMIITKNKDGIGRILGYGLDGMLLFETSAPKDYNLLYLSMVNNMPSVVCEGSKSHADKYGRNTWQFTINTSSGELSKYDLSH